MIVNIFLLYPIKKQPLQNRALMRMTKKTSLLEQRVHNKVQVQCQTN